MKRMDVHLMKEKIGDSGAIDIGAHGDGVKIQIVYSESRSEYTESLSFGTLQIRIADYENFLKALNKARKYVNNPKRKDVVAVSFQVEKQE